MIAKFSEGYLVIRLEPGDDLIGSVLSAASDSGVSAGFIVSGIGHLAPVKLGYFIGEGVYAEREFAEGGEVLALCGNISLKDGKPFAHIHATLGRDDYSLFGGHLVSATCDVTAEILILKVADSIKLIRRLEQSTKLFGLFIE